MQNKESNIPNIESKKISNYNMCDHALSLMNTMKYQIYDLIAYALRKAMSCRVRETQSST